MTDAERKAVQDALTDCVVARAYLNGANDRAQAQDMMASAEARLRAILNP